VAADETTEQENTTQVNEAAESQEEFADLNPPPIEKPSTAPAKPAVAATPAETPAAPTHPQPLIDAAIEAGLSERMIAKLDTDTLYEVLVNQHRKLSEVASSQPRRQREDDDERPRRQESQADPFDAALAKAEEAGIDPNLIAMNRFLAQSLREIKASEAQRLKAESERRVADTFDAADEAIESLAKSTEQKFSKEQKQTLFRAAGITDTDSARTVKRKITEAGLTLFQGLTKKKSTQPPLPTNGKKPSAEEIDKARMNPPTSSLPSRTKGDLAARAAVHDYFVQNGIQQDRSHIELEGVPE
jgi:hypothetical protein